MLTLRPPLFFLFYKHTRRQHKHQNLGAPIEAVQVAASPAAVRPAAGGGPGSLTLVDSRSGKRYEIPILEGGVIRATDLKQIKAGGDGVGLKTYDPG